MHTSVKRALAVVSSHYAINLEAVSDGYVLLEDDEEADVEVVKLLEAAVYLKKRWSLPRRPPILEL